MNLATDLVEAQEQDRLVGEDLKPAPQVQRIPRGGESGMHGPPSKPLVGGRGRGVARRLVARRAPSSPYFPGPRASSGRAA